jgi:FeS assembly SUF system protein
MQMTQSEDCGVDLSTAPAAGSGEEEGTHTSASSVSRDDVVASLRTVHDPEIPVNIYDLGLVYRIEIKEHGIVEIEMTLTAPGCPVAGEIISNVQRAVLGTGGVSLVNVNLVFDPPWDQSKMSEEAKLELGFF